jgi:hypothetical protein
MKPTSDVRELRQWVDVLAPLRGEPGARTPERLLEVVRQFELDTNPRYQRTATATFCNVFASDITRALGAEIPHWLGKRELTANLTLEWLSTLGTLAGWQEVAEEKAQEAANRGEPAVAIWRNPGRGSGHVALLIPSTVPGETRIAQAGARCFSDGTLAEGFGRASPIRFFVHP